VASTVFLDVVEQGLGLFTLNGLDLLLFSLGPGTFLHLRWVLCIQIARQILGLLFCLRLCPILILIAIPLLILLLFLLRTRLFVPLILFLLTVFALLVLLRLFFFLFDFFQRKFQVVARASALFGFNRIASLK
jgi:hypothetical protein